MSRYVYVRVQVFSVHSCVNTLFFLYNELYAEHLCVTTDPHKATFLHGMQQTDPQVFSFVVHGNHIEGYCLWHSQDDG